MRPLKSIKNRSKKSARRFGVLRTPEPNFCGEKCVFRHLPQPTEVQELRSYDYEQIIPRVASDETRKQARQIYQPLRPWQTRLIELIPSTGPEQMPTCKLFTVDFIDMAGVGVPDTDDVVDYSAISYVWGQITLDSQILCNGIWLPICTSLAQALFHISRSSDSTRYYWCDAICIDQQNSTERALQVRNMMRIFEKADRVVAWLGVADSDVLPPLTISEDIADNIYHLGKAGRRPSDHVRRYQHSEQCAKAEHLLHESLIRFSMQPWFLRTWIRQEIFAAKNTVFGAADTFAHIDLRAIHHVLLALAPGPTSTLASDSYWSYHESSRLPIDASSKPFDVMVSHWKHDGTSLPKFRPPDTRKDRYSVHSMKTLQYGTKFQTSDPRDRVYALIGILANPSTRRFVDTSFSGASLIDAAVKVFPIDYAKSISEVYQDFMKFLINATRTLDCLCVVQDRRMQDPDLPSWLLDWRSDTDRHFLQPSWPDPYEADSLLPAEHQSLEVSNQLAVTGYVLLDVESFGRTRSAMTTLFDRRTLFDVDPEPARCLMNIVTNAPYYVRAMSPGFETWVPSNTKRNDKIIVAKGAKLPLVVRHLRDGLYSFVGPAIVTVLPFNGKDWLKTRGLVLGLSLRPGWWEKENDVQKIILI